jgi:hypothetical protein
MWWSAEMLARGLGTARWAFGMKGLSSQPVAKLGPVVS